MFQKVGFHPETQIERFLFVFMYALKKSDSTWSLHTRSHVNCAYLQSCIGTVSMFEFEDSTCPLYYSPSAVPLFVSDGPFLGGGKTSKEKVWSIESL